MLTPLGISGRHLPLKIAVPTKQDSLHHWKFPRWTPVCDLHMTFKLPNVYDYITKLCSQQAEVIQNHENEHVHSREQGEARQKI
jgi:hypothetical protein